MEGECDAQRNHAGGSAVAPAVAMTITAMRSPMAPERVLGARILALRLAALPPAAAGTAAGMLAGTWRLIDSHGPH
jgi:hypothetical protein